MSLVQDLWSVLTSRALPSTATANSLANAVRTLSIAAAAGNPAASSALDRLLRQLALSSGDAANSLSKLAYDNLRFLRDAALDGTETANSIGRMQRQMFAEATAAAPVADSMADRIIAGAGGVASIFAGFGYPGLGFGDGSDGARTVSASTTDPSGTILSQYTTLVINASQVLTINSANSYRIVLATTGITVNGEFNVDGRGAAGGTDTVGTQGGDGGAAASTAVAWLATGSGGGGGGSDDTAGKAGGGAGGAGGAGGPVTGTGGAGVAGNIASGLVLARAVMLFGPGGLTGGPPIHPSLWTLLNAFGAGGGGGGRRSGVPNGGTGGTGGGTILLAAPTITIGGSGIVSANGANGSNSGANYAGGGGGGGGGAVILIYRTLNNSGTVRANGGTGGQPPNYPTGTGVGGRGAAGLVIRIPVK